MKRTVISLAALVAAVSMASTAWAHCQIPCGIYDDPMRFTQMEEHVTTIEKSIKQIEELSQAENPNWNQIVRWVTNKEDHANQLSEIVTYYFLAQRVKPADPDDKAAHSKYVKQLQLLHGMVFYAMKAKQTTDLENVEKLRSLIQEFRASYLGEPAATTAAACQACPAQTAHSHPHPHPN